MMRTKFIQTGCRRSMRMGTTLLLGALVHTASLAQVMYPAPPLVIHDVEWTSGTHHYAQSAAIRSPDDPELPASISASADVEFVSGTEVHLTDGFHAGSFSVEGRFQARINEQFGDPAAMVLIPSDPGAQLVNGVVRVPKWEKLEIGLELPQGYQVAIDGFFERYYSNGFAQAATPAEVDAAHDLNPYADDSLQLVMTLTKPNGEQTMKWGFYMKEARWQSDQPLARMMDDNIDPRDPYRVRFRVSPTEEGVWHVDLSVKAPHTVTLDGLPLPDLHFPGYAFVCDAALAENHGFLNVNTVNRRNLEFDDGTSFFGLGPNVADQRHGDTGEWQWHTYYLHDFTKMQESMEMLHDVGGNFMRLFMFKNSFSPEWVNLGVYDHFVTPPVCSTSESATNPNCDLGWMVNYRSSGQHQSWAMDSMLTKAREENIYVQVCMDPHMPTTAFEKFLWGDNPYVIHFLEPARQAGLPYNMKGYFYENGDPANTDIGVFYYWKRRFKYMLARWGYSVNLAIYEPFNELSQMLTYEEKDLGNDLPPITGCAWEDLQSIPFRDMCPENRILWERDPYLPGTVDQWFTDIGNYIRGPVDFDNPATSPLGEDRKLMLLSYAGVPDPLPTDHFLPFTNRHVDLLDIHQYANPNIGEVNMIDWRMNVAYDRVSQIRDNYQSQDAQGNLYKKPFSHGEMCYSTNVEFAGTGYEIEKMFHNYDVSFHNEIWSSAFSGKFAAGTSWHWERIFWWDDALRVPPDDPNNLFPQPGPQNSFSTVLGDVNILSLNGAPMPVPNRTLHHHFKPLADLLAHPSWVPYNFFNADYTAHEVFDDTHQNELECYYLKNADDNLAIGWVHNRNAWVMRNFYLTSSVQNFLGCEAPNENSQTLTLTGFEPNSNFFISWFATRLNSTTHPAHTIDPIESTASGNITIDLTDQFGGIAGNYMDTLRSDYAFIVTPAPFPKSRPPQLTQLFEAETDWDFTIYPNPARTDLILGFTDDIPKTVELLDLTGRLVGRSLIVTARIHHCSLDGLAKGPYWVKVTDGNRNKVKKLIVH